MGGLVTPDLGRSLDQATDSLCIRFIGMSRIRSSSAVLRPLKPGTEGLKGQPSAFGSVLAGSITCDSFGLKVADCQMAVDARKIGKHRLSADVAPV